MARKSSCCPHVANVGDVSWEDIWDKKGVQTTCQECDVKGPNLWLCLQSGCLYVGCGESAKDHSTEHAEGTQHSLNLNMTTMRIWCYTCNTEVFKEGNTPPLVLTEKSHTVIPPPIASQRASAMTISSHSLGPPTPEDSESDDEDENNKPRGLTGLQNIGNTCYMNAAIQALSNCPPLTRFFLDCSGFVRTDRKPMLCRSYLKLMTEMWHKRRPSYVVPSGVAHGIKIVHPMFRGYTQQDSQEFLRCFMDELHEELKQPVLTSPDSEQEHETSDTESSGHEDPVEVSPERNRPVAVESNSQSDTDYETCDSGSGLSSEWSSVDNSLSNGTESSNTGECSDKTTSGTSQQEDAANSPGQEEGSGDSVSQMMTRAKLKAKQSVKDKNKVNPEGSVDSQDTDSGLDVKTPKTVKDNVNFANKYASRSSSDSGLMTDTDSGEVGNAVSELEPLQGSRIRSASGRSRNNSETRTHSPQHRAGSNSHKGHRRKRNVEYRSVISDIFDGKILSSVQCLTCERVSSTKETFQDLSLPIPSKDHIHMLHASQTSSAHKASCGEVTLNQGWFSWMFGWMKSWFWGPTIALQDCLGAFFSADDLKGDNMYSCEKCKKLRNGVKYSKVLKLPEILCIHLKRFRHEFMFSTKIGSYVSFPLDGLDMSHYLHKDVKDQRTLYDLVAVICHHGTAGGGHYTSYGLNYVNEQWYEFDDQYVTEVDLQTVENCEAYVLFYRKRNDHMIPQRQQAEQILASPESSLMKFFVGKQWINRFNTFAEPGPITNQDFLCKHGGVPPHKYQYVGELTEEMPQQLWEFLHETFGGGPAVNHLYQCSICLAELERLKKRQKYEVDHFIQLNNEFQNEDNPPIIYAISMSWFKEWENFVRAKTEEPPGPIENGKIAVMKGGQWTVRMNADYGQLSEEMWHFLYDIYGGGPELVLRQNTPPSPEVRASEVSEGCSRNADVK